MVLLIEPEARARVEAAIAKSGGQLMPLQIERQGVQVSATD